jgi:hypothetical protein
MRYIETWVIGAIAIVAIIFFLNYASLKNYEFFAPKYQEVKTKVFKESAAYNDGMVRDLELLRLEYLKSDEASKAAMRPIIIHRFSVYPAEKLTADQRAFLAQIKGE